MMNESNAQDAVARQQAASDGSESLFVVDEGALEGDCDHEFDLAVDDRGQRIIIGESCDKKDGDAWFGVATVPCPPACDTGRSEGQIRPMLPPCPPLCSSGPYLRISEAIAAASGAAARLAFAGKEVDNAKERYHKEKPDALHCFVIGKEAARWLKAGGGTIAVVLPARDKDNKHIALLSGYKKDGSRISDSRYFRLKSACN